MTIRDMQDRMWAELPLVRRHLLGRSRVNDLVSIAIEQAPTELFRHVSNNASSQEIVLVAWGQNVKRGYCLLRGSTDEKSFGPLFWILIGPLLQIMLKKLLDWFFSSPKNAASMNAWKRRSSGND